MIRKILPVLLALGIASCGVRESKKEVIVETKVRAQVYLFSSDWDLEQRFLSDVVLGKDITVGGVVYHSIGTVELGTMNFQDSVPSKIVGKIDLKDDYIGMYRRGEH